MPPARTGQPEADWTQLLLDVYRSGGEGAAPNEVVTNVICGIARIFGLALVLAARKQYNGAVTVSAASHEDMSAFEATLPASDEAEVDTLARDLAKLRPGSLLPHQRAELRALTPAKREEMRRMVASTSNFASGAQKVILLFCASVLALVALLFAIGWALSP